MNSLRDLRSLTTRLKVVPTRRCDVDCLFCYWPLPIRRTDTCLTVKALQRIVVESAGFDELHWFSGEFPGFVDELLIPTCGAMSECGYRQLKITTSGVFFSEQTIRFVLDKFDGRVLARRSIEGPWGHGNWAADGRHGDVLGTFLNICEECDRLQQTVNWLTCHHRRQIEFWRNLEIVAIHWMSISG